MRLNVRLRECATRNALADALCVPIAAPDLVSLAGSDRGVVSAGNASNGKWRLRKEASHRNKEGKVFSFPPPNASLQRFIDEEVLSLGLVRGAFDPSLPPWLSQVVRAQEAAIRSAADRLAGGTPSGSAEREVTALAAIRRVARPNASLTERRIARRKGGADGGGRGRTSGDGPGGEPSAPNNGRVSVGPDWILAPPPSRRPADPPGRRVIVPRVIPVPRRPPRKRGSPESEQVAQLLEDNRLLKAELHSALSHIKELDGVVEGERCAKETALAECARLRLANRRLLEKISELERSNYVLSYEDLRPGGVLGKHVKDFTFFPSFESNDAFLDLVNFSDQCEPGQGLCNIYQTLPM